MQSYKHGLLRVHFCNFAYDIPGQVTLNSHLLENPPKSPSVVQNVRKTCPNKVERLLSHKQQLFGSFLHKRTGFQSIFHLEEFQNKIWLLAWLRVDFLVDQLSSTAVALLLACFSSSKLFRNVPVEVKTQFVVFQHISNMISCQKVKIIKV